MARHDSKSNIKQDDGLFLLEVLIDKIVFTKSPCFSDKDFRTCVNIECPAVEPLEICDDDPGVCVAKSGGPFVKNFNNGKSCLFSLKEGDISKAMSKFPVKVSVSKALPCGCLPTKIVMGEATIDMTKEFVQARKKFLEDPNNVSYQALKDSFRILAPDGSEAGEIIMFLRISCFGKLIITRFQGAGGLPNLGGGVASSSGVVDRSCNPRKDFQTTQDPCACGAARGHGGGSSGAPCSGGGGGLCPPARDPYNSTPCEDPDDPCYCSGPKPTTKQQMLCKNTDQYCLHVPKGALPSMPFYQDLTEEQKQTIRAPSEEEPQDLVNYYIGAAIDKYQNKESLPNILIEKVDNGCLQLYLSLPKESSTTCKLGSVSSTPSTWTLRSKRRSVSFSDNVNYVSNDDTCSIYSRKMDMNEPIFGKKETTVYMTLFDESCRHRTSGTQATASINKCFQASPAQSVLPYQPSTYGGTTSGCSSIYSMPTVPFRSIIQRPVSGSVHYSDMICYMGEKEKSKVKGMGSPTYLNRTVIVAPMKQEKKCKRGGKVDKKTSSSSIPRKEVRKTKGSSAGTSPSKAVSIKVDPEKPCPASFGTKGDIIATISHVKIGPREFCPVHGKEPCQGPKCIVAANSAEEKAPVKISNVNNPRRGVFELVIRRISGAPLARNELMLEWTPPPARPPPCGVPCPVVCSSPGPCRPAKCRMIVCRSSCEPKCCKKRCKKPCGPKPCRVVPCLPPPSYKPCKPCKPCDPPFPFKASSCSPCPPIPSCSPCPPCPSAPPCCNPKKPCRPSRPCKPFKCRPCSPCKPFKPCPPSKPYKSCRPYKPCKPDLASPTPRTSIIFRPNALGRHKPRCCKPRCSQCGPCNPCGPFKPTCTSPPCLSCCKPCKPRKPCGPAPCRRPACKRCKPRKSCKPCPPPRCRPCKPCPSPPSCDACPPLPCSSPCYLPSCSNPCFRTCPVGHKRTRKCRSQPKMRAHKKRISPCWNRENSCPVVRCRSVPGPCTSCCGLPPCPPPVCRPPRCCKSACSSCCG